MMKTVKSILVVGLYAALIVAIVIGIVKLGVAIGGI